MNQWLKGKIYPLLAVISLLFLISNYSNVRKVSVQLNKEDLGADRNVYISMSLCWDNTTKLFSKDGFPYHEAARYFKLINP